jgi:hypothetical protein
MAMMFDPPDSFLFKPMQRSLSLCASTSDEYSSEDEIENRLNEKGGTFSSLENHVTPRTPTFSLQMRPFPRTGLIFESLPFPSLIMRPSPRRWNGTSPESYAVHSALYLDLTGDDDSSLSHMPEYDNNSTMRDIALDEFILDSPKSHLLQDFTQGLSPPPLRVTTRNVIYTDDFGNDLTTSSTNHSLFLPEAF